MTRATDDKKPKTLRCAIYTRKSTEEGLEQDFNTLDAQRESGEAYIVAQKHEGWVCLGDHYDDGGFTGGNMDRPALQRLLNDLDAGKVDCIVVYKVDRLSRSLIDFAKIMDVLERNHVSFVSVTQQFNTSTSMGRLMLNVLLSFAQFEREIISERTRDKIAAARRRGKWTGGPPVLGYDRVRDGRGPRLVVNEGEARRVRIIFQKYMETGSLLATVRWLNERGWPNKRYKTFAGRVRGGRACADRATVQRHDFMTIGGFGCAQGSVGKAVRGSVFLSVRRGRAPRRCATFFARPRFGCKVITLQGEDGHGGRRGGASGGGRAMRLRGGRGGRRRA